MIYNIALYLYSICAYIVSLFSKKVKLLVKGHFQTFRILQKQMQEGGRYIWFHAASLGEFEQGRPLMERLRKEHPEYKILLTFFSPSGYEVRKNYEGADVICYLPFDTPSNARKFVKTAHPVMAFFIKYEFWSNYYHQLHKHGIPIYSVSSIFRPGQLFFRWYGSCKVLTYITRLYVQNEESKQLLAKHGIHHVTVVGDTRFDRVIDIRQQAKDLPLVEAFKNGSMVQVAGSSWQPDEDLIIPYFNTHPDIKLILAPHVIDESHLKDIESKLKRPYVRYTDATEENVKTADCLIINCFGLLSSIYRYGELTYVGGGFGVGIHNVPEAAVYGIPVMVGPNNKKFREARQLLQSGGCIEIVDADSYNSNMDRLINDSGFRHSCGQTAGNYIADNAGVADKIFRDIFG